MKWVKTCTDSGVVREVKIFNVGDRADIKNARPPRPRFKDDAEREAFCLDISRRRHAQIFNANFGPTSLYSTLTFSDEYEVHTFKDARRVRDNFVRRIQYRFPKARIVLYMGRGKGTHRIHLHMVSEGVPEDLIRKLWGMGDVLRIDHLREHNYYDGIDHGQDYTGLANYLFNHWMPEQGGRRRWKQTANLLKPDKGKPVEVKREYSEKRPPRTPKGYMLVEIKKTKYGYFYFKYVKKPSPHKRERRKAGASGL